jgi:hypothetical protein
MVGLRHRRRLIVLEVYGSGHYKSPLKSFTVHGFALNSYLFRQVERLYQLYSHFF